MKKLALVGIGILLLIGFYSANKFFIQKKGMTMQNTQYVTKSSLVEVTPISHATMVLHLGGQVIYTDPVGGAAAFNGQPTPNLILVTDIHADHLNADTLAAVSKQGTIILVPKAVSDELPKTIPGSIVVMQNGDTTTQNGIEIEAIPMYNVPESFESFHTKGRGNGYVISAEGKRVYIAGDTSATPEMKALKNIDVAFVPMNLPYTMSVEEAADATVAFKPKVVHPYHYRGQDGFSDINKFKELVNAKDPNIQVELLNFYPGQ